MTLQNSQRPTDGIVLAITFQYYRDLPRAMTFYEDVLGFTLVIDQGWSKIYQIDGQELKEPTYDNLRDKPQQQPACDRRH